MVTVMVIAMVMVTVMVIVTVMFMVRTKTGGRSLWEFLKWVLVCKRQRYIDLAGMVLIADSNTITLCIQCRDDVIAH
jgi:hypothetical protein